MDSKRSVSAWDATKDSPADREMTTHGSWVRDRRIARRRAFGEVAVAMELGATTEDLSLSMHRFHARGDSRAGG